MKSLLVFAALLSIAVAYSDLEYRQAFTAWMQEHNRIYSAEEFQPRFAAFKDNMDYVRDWNAKNSQTVLGLNKMADLTNKEYRSIYLGLRLTAAPRSGDAMKLSTTRVNANATVDWRTKGAVTAVKDQGQCGSCWSFSTTGSVEAAHFFATGNLVSLSEQNLVDCSTAEGNEGCNGGLMDDAFTYIIKNKGIDTEESYPYTAKDGTCTFNAANVGATISGFTDVPAKDEDALATAANGAPISVAIDASHNSFQLYKSGIYTEAKCSQTKLDHGVLVVGYGDGFWLVKNSWGADWGMDGYIEMTRGKNNQCGIASMASYPKA